MCYSRFECILKKDPGPRGLACVIQVSISLNKVTSRSPRLPVSQWVRQFQCAPESRFRWLYTPVAAGSDVSLAFLLSLQWYCTLVATVSYFTECSFKLALRGRLWIRMGLLHVCFVISADVLIVL